MKKKMMLLMVALGAMTAQAYDYPYLTFQKTDGTVQSVAVDDLTIAVSDGQLVATNADGSQTFTLTELSKMYFSTTDAAAIEDVTASEAAVEVYTVQGVSKGAFSSMEAARATLQRGVYIIKQGVSTFKIAVK